MEGCTFFLHRMEIFDDFIRIRTCKKPGCWSECRIKSPSVEVISLFRIFFVKITVDQNLSMTWLYICASHFIQPFFQFLAFIQGSFETMRGDALLFSLEENYPHSESDKKTDDQESILNIKHMLYKHTEVKLTGSNRISFRSIIWGRFTDLTVALEWTT